MDSGFWWIDGSGDEQFVIRSRTEISARTEALAGISRGYAKFERMIAEEQKLEKVWEVSNI